MLTVTVELSRKGFDEGGQYVNVREVIRALGRTFPRDEPSSIARTVALNEHKTDRAKLAQQLTKDEPSAFQQMWGALKSKHIAALDKKTLSPLATDDFLSGIFDLEALNNWGITTNPRLNFTRMANKTVIGWYDSTLDAASWFRLVKLEPNKAAALLCRFNPDNSADDPLTSSNDETKPDDYKRLTREFEDVSTDGVSRTLSQWHQVAHDRALKHHSWIDEYQQAIAENVEVQAVSASAAISDRGLSAACADRDKDLPAITETSASRRAGHDLSKERGCRRLILEHWDEIEKLHPTGADGRQVLRVLKRAVADTGDKIPELKTIQNKLGELRKKGLIP